MHLQLSHGTDLDYYLIKKIETYLSVIEISTMGRDMFGNNN